MKIIRKCFDVLFSSTNDIGEIILSIGKNYGCLIEIIVFIAFAICFKIVYTNRILAVLLAILFVFVFFAGNAREALLSVSGFMTTGFIYWFCMAGLLYILICNIISASSLLIEYLVFMTAWIIYSLIANNRVATVVNQIHSTILALVVLSKDMILSSLPVSFLEQTDMTGDTYGNIIEKVFTKIVSPFLAINLMALLFCILKGYWIEKYNNNQDIGTENTEDILKEQEI